MIPLPPEVLFYVIVAWLFIVGTVIGSFLNVCVYRIPQHENLADQLRGLVSPGSHCPKCQVPIRKSDNIPLIGWLRLQGRCRNCRCSISFRYPLIELLNGLLFVVVYWLELPQEFQTRLYESCTWSPLGPQIADGWLRPDATLLHVRYVYHMILLEALLVASLIDFDTMTIPDGSTLPAMAFGFLGAAAFGQMFLVPVWFQDPSLAMYAPESLRSLFGPMMIEQQFLPSSAINYGSRFEFPEFVHSSPYLHGFTVSVAGFLVGGGLVWGVRLIGQWILKREAMGFGDVILMALVGSFLGWQPTLVAFFLAPFFAMAVTVGRWLLSFLRKGSRQEMYIPYGPYLSLGTLVVVLFWKDMWPLVGRWFSAGPFVPMMGVVLLVLMVPALMLVQIVKRILGIPLHPEMGHEEVWTSADTLTYLAGEVVDRDKQHWVRNNEWPGEAAAQGMIQEERWRSRDYATGWPE